LVLADFSEEFYHKVVVSFPKITFYKKEKDQSVLIGLLSKYIFFERCRSTTALIQLTILNSLFELFKIEFH